MRRRSPRQRALTPRYVRSRFAFCKTSAGGRLYRFRPSCTIVLSLEHGQLRQYVFTRDGYFSPARFQVNFKALCERAELVDETANGQRLLFPIDHDAIQIRRFVRLIPADIWDRVNRYPSSIQFRMLSLFLRAGESAWQLHDCGCFGLAAVFGLADRFRKKPISKECLQRWLRLPQHQALGKLGLPATKRVARILRKFALHACVFSSLRHLRRLHDPQLARELSHLPEITTVLLMALPFVAPGRRLLTPRCLRELSELTFHESWAVVEQLDQFMSQHRKLEQLAGQPLPLPTFDKPAQVLFADLPTYYRVPLVRFPSRTIPPPPFADQPGWLTWIRTPLALMQEAADMHHCAFTYLEKMMLGIAALASVQVGDERATLLVQNLGTDRWDMHDLRCRWNAAPSNKLRDKVEDWLHAQPNYGSLIPF